MQGTSDSAEQELLGSLRQELELIEGGAEPGKAARWKIHDPLAGRFFEIDARVVDILACWSAGTVEALRRRLDARGHVDISEEDIRQIQQFLDHNDLLEASEGRSFDKARRYREASRPSWWKWLLHHYLFVRIPLVYPGRGLKRCLPLVAIFFHRGFWLFTAILGVIGLYLVSRQWESFFTTLPAMFSVSGVVAFSLSLVLVKTLHELGHGFCATRFGVRVSSMGVALIVMMPVLFTDTTDAWRLPRRRKRVLIDLAGVAVELVIAVYATLAWVFLPGGALRFVAFALATTGWVLSLAVNLNPLMRFDGYYLFSDLLGIVNLQERGFAMGRWWLREGLFGFGDTPPEALSRAKRRVLIGYALAVWVYRFFLFLGIALVVYHLFFKVLGVFLFSVEILWFIVMPILRELMVWWKRRREAGRRVLMTLAVAAGIAVFVALPLPHRITVPVVFGASQQVPVFAHRAARVEQVLVRVGDVVERGQVLVRLEVPALQQRERTVQEHLNLVDRRLDRRSADNTDLSQSLVLESERDMQRQQLAGLTDQRRRLDVIAPMDGTVVELADYLHPGRWVGTDLRLALVASTDRLSARGYVSSDDLGLLALGQPCFFVDDERLWPQTPMHVERIAAAASRYVDQWMLASDHGGPIAARPDDQRSVPERALFELLAVSDQDQSSPLTELRGELHLEGQPSSLAASMARRVAQVLVREWGS
ncbi:site-2 protease family protein [Halomonas sp. H10-59]|uniref:Site-2 protease family protein n=1 Tax=Halomonas sp. H10-59 TaxID=2950874 RepID=A0AAU7L081_9GAMM